MTYTCPECKDDNLLVDECSFLPNGNIRACKKCYNKYKRYINKKNYRLKYNKDWHKFYHLKRTYGLSKEQFEIKLKLQNNGCAICKQEFNKTLKIAVDHNHKTNEIRNLLCYRCNSILGLLHENENLVWDILEYLKKFNLSKIA